jgi:hypothetical protein
MSRYVCHFLVKFSSQNIRSVVSKLLETCRLELVYELDDYLKAREIPGKVSFAKLVTAEILIDVTTATREAVKLSVVVKNEELPLNSNNHCRQIFDTLRLAIAHHHNWHPINGLQSNGLPAAKTPAALPTNNSGSSSSLESAYPS